MYFIEIWNQFKLKLKNKKIIKKKHPPKKPPTKSVKDKKIRLDDFLSITSDAKLN